METKKQDEEKEKEEEEKDQVKKANEEEHERRMQALNQRVRHDLPLTEAEWAAWRRWIGLGGGRGKRGRRRNFLEAARALGNLEIPQRALPFWQSLFCVLVSSLPAWVDNGYLLMRQPEAFPRLQVFHVVMDLGSWNDSRLGSTVDTCLCVSLRSLQSVCQKILRARGPRLLRSIVPALSTLGSWTFLRAPWYMQPLAP